jgi:hypothetical protein
MAPNGGNAVGYGNAGQLIPGKRTVPNGGDLAGYGNAGQLVVAKRAFPNGGDVIGYGNAGQLGVPKRLEPNGGNAVGYGNAGNVGLVKSVIPNGRNRQVLYFGRYLYYRCGTDISGNRYRLTRFLYLKTLLRESSGCHEREQRPR